MLSTWSLLLEIWRSEAKAWYWIVPWLGRVSSRVSMERWPSGNGRVCGVAVSLLTDITSAPRRDADPSVEHTVADPLGFARRSAVLSAPHRALPPGPLVRQLLLLGVLVRHEKVSLSSALPQCVQCSPASSSSSSAFSVGYASSSSSSSSPSLFFASSVLILGSVCCPFLDRTAEPVLLPNFSGRAA